jgi:glyoxylase-like metal-dependent hydrolase (beta-lactamase superfamily II)
MDSRDSAGASDPSAGSIKIGNVTVTPFVSSRFRLDGGSMFGVVPRTLWARIARPDEANRISLNSNSLLVETDGALVLVEPGMGSKLDQKRREIYGLDDGEVVSALEEMGIGPGDIDIVVPTHLHLDHAGGCTRLDEGGRAAPAFEKARVMVQRLEWEAATSPHPLSAGSYRTEDFEPLAEPGLLELVDGDSEIAPGLTVELTGGHTPGHQVLRIASSGQEALFTGDLVPTTAHLKLNWLMAWDMEPLAVYEWKSALLEECADRGALLFTAHDPVLAGCRIRRAGKGAFAVEGGSEFRACSRRGHMSENPE